MKHLILNLPIRADRRKFMEHKLAVAGITDYEFFPALSPSDGLELGKFHAFCRPCEPAIYQSTVDMMKRFLESGADRYIHLEDDVYFRKGYRELLAKYEDIIENGDLVYLGGQRDTKEKITYDEPIRLRKYMCGAYGVVISRRYAEYFVANCPLRPYSRVVDRVMSNRDMCRRFKIMMILPRLIIPEMRDSDNMGDRRFFHFVKNRLHGVNLSDFDCWPMYKEFIKDFVKNVLNLPVVAVVGTWRGGTSCTAGIVSRLGVHLGFKFSTLKGKWNPTGFYEADALLNLCLRAHPGDQVKLAMTEDDFKRRLREWITAGCADVTRLGIAKMIGGKHPSLTYNVSLLIDAWGPGLHLVRVHRDKEAVRKSLEKAGWKKRLATFESWYPIHERQLVMPITDVPCLDVRYEDIIGDTEASVRKIAGFLPVPPEEKQIQAAIGFVRPDLDHSKSG